MKRFLTLALLVLAMLVVMASCDSAFLRGASKFDYEVNEDGETCTITGIGKCKQRNISIGDYIDGYKITAISDGAFSGCDNLVSVTIGDSVTTIGNQAFYNCSNL